MPVRIKHALWTLLPCLALAVPAVAQAASPRYTYAEIGYVNADFDDVDDDGDGFLVGGSLAVHPNVHLVADYQDIGLSGDNDFSAYTLGAGFNYSLSPSLDGVLRLRYVSAEFDGRFGDNDEDGYGFDAVLRAMVSPRLELNGGLRYVDVFDDNTSLVLGAFYDVIPNLAIGGELEFSDDFTGLFLKGRYYFGSPF
jgi:hypothetical protein